MSIEELIQYDKDHKEQLALNYYEYILACRKLVDTDYALRKVSDWKSPQLAVSSSGFEISNIFHFYYVLNVQLQASLCQDDRYRIYFSTDTVHYQTFEIYEYVDRETYQKIYQKISDFNIELQERD